MNANSKHFLNMNARGTTRMRKSMHCGRLLSRSLLCGLLTTALGLGLVGSIAEPAVCADVPRWQPLETIDKPHARHEAAFVECNDRFFLLGGRKIKPVDIFDPATRTWTEGAPPPVEIHHFQPVVWQDRIVLAGAMTGAYPHETALDRMLIYTPATNAWSWGLEIPENRRRGGAGAVMKGNTLYMVCGIRNGHWDGWVHWLDRVDLATGNWEILPDAPRVRDHFQAVIIADKIYAAGGRKTSGATRQVFDLVTPEVDVFDLASQHWTTLPDTSNLPIPRAGCFAMRLGSDLVIAGGESMQQTPAHNEVQILDTTTGRWRTASLFTTGRHGTGIIQWQDALYTCAGSGSRGGKPELDTMEILQLKAASE